MVAILLIYLARFRTMREGEVYLSLPRQEPVRQGELNSSLELPKMRALLDSRATAPVDQSSKLRFMACSVVR